MDSNYWYRGTKAVDFRSIPGIWGYRRGSETIPPDGSALVLLRLEPLRRARLGHGLSRLWVAGLRGGFRLLAVKLIYTFARRSWLRRATFSAGDSPSDPPASNWRVTRSGSVSSNSSRATVIKAPRRAPHRRHRRR